MDESRPVVLWLPAGAEPKAKITWRDAPGPMLAKLRARADGGPSSPPLTPGETRRAVDEFCHLFPGIEYAGGHIVLSDGNLEPGHIGYCIRRCLDEAGTPDERDSAEAIDFMACLLSLDDEELFDDEGGEA